MNKNPERMQPCLMPVFTLKVSVKVFLQIVADENSVYRSLVIWTSFVGMPRWRIFFQNESLCILSKAFSVVYEVNVHCTVPFGTLLQNLAERKESGLHRTCPF